MPRVVILVTIDRAFVKWNKPVELFLSRKFQLSYHTGSLLIHAHKYNMTKYLMQTQSLPEIVVI